MKKQRKNNAGYQDSFPRKLPDGLWLLASAGYILLLLVDWLLLSPAGHVPARMLIYGGFLLPGSILCYYLGLKGSLAGVLIFVPVAARHLSAFYLLGSAESLLFSVYTAVLSAIQIMYGVLTELLLRREARLNLLSLTDELSGLYNRRFFFRCLEREVDLARRYNQPLSLVLIDIDNFKQYNDTWGHPQGDRALAKAAEVLKETLRTTDTVARYGGEEFAVILPQTNLINAKKLCERLRETIARSPIPGPGTTLTEPLTASIGVVLYEAPMTAEQFLGEADRVMYYAKSSGKNLVTCVSGFER